MEITETLKRWKFTTQNDFTIEDDNRMEMRNRVFAKNCRRIDRRERTNAFYKPKRVGARDANKQ